MSDIAMHYVEVGPPWQDAAYERPLVPHSSVFSFERAKCTPSREVLNADTIESGGGRRNKFALAVKGSKHAKKVACSRMAFEGIGGQGSCDSVARKRRQRRK